jgi:ribonuclease HI
MLWSDLVMGELTVEVFCDGSLTNSVLSDVFTSVVGEEYVGRAIVLMPSHDIGMITQTRVGMLTQRGTPASNEAEVFAIRTALDLCDAKGLTDYAVYSDCQGAVERFGEHPVEWRSRQQLRLPNDFFDKVLSRAAYLRSSSRKVSTRRPPQPHQIEAFELFNAPHLEFRLSESPLWERIRRDAARHPRTLGA